MKPRPEPPPRPPPPEPYDDGMTWKWAVGIVLALVSVGLLLSAAMSCSWFKGGEVDSPVGTVKIKGTDKPWVPNPAPTTYVTSYNYYYGCSSSDAATDGGKD